MFISQLIKVKADLLQEINDNLHMQEHREQGLDLHFPEKAMNKHNKYLSSNYYR